MASVNLTALPPDVASTLPSLEHLQSNDYFQQLLRIDSALEALSISRSNLELKLQAPAVSEEQPLSVEAAAEYDATTQSIADLEQAVETFEELQAEARRRLELRARSLRRSKTGIMDMPGEVLMAIFQNFRPPLDFSKMSPPKGHSGADVETIKNIRLTCLRFRQNSSHLLIGRLEVSPNMASLDHLERVSSHPELSRGERILSIDMRYYTAYVARDFNIFLTMCFGMLQDDISALRDSVEFLKGRRRTLNISVESLTQIPERREDGKGQEEKSSLLPKGVSIESAEEGLLELRRIESIWEPFANGSPIEESAQLDTALLALREGHKHYQEMYQQQQKLIQDGSFARAVAATVAASKSKPILKSSQKMDFSPFSDPHRFHDAVSYIARPHEWWCSGGEMARDLPESLLWEIPLAIRAADTKLAGLEVCLHYPPHNLELRMSDEQLSCFTEVTKDLEVFKFASKPYSPDDVPNLEDSRDFYAYLCAVMGRQTVPNLYLDLATGRFNFYQYQFRIEPLLHASNWHGLKSAVLGRFDVRLEDLKKLIDMLEPGTRLRVAHIHLRSGTWAEALDCLRSKVSQDSWVSCPRGAECRRMAKGRYGEIFDVRYNKAAGVEASKATQYIRSVEGFENPLREIDWTDEANLEPQGWAGFICGDEADSQAL